MICVSITLFRVLDVVFSDFSLSPVQNVLCTEERRKEDSQLVVSTGNNVEKFSQEVSDY
jgi:hypothetical protein